MKKLGLILNMVVVISIIFTVSCLSKQVPVSETYYETEYKTQVDKKENVIILKPKAEWWVPRPADICLLQQLNNTYYYGYEINIPEGSSGQVKITTMKEPQSEIPMAAIDLYWYVLVVDLTGIVQLPPLDPKYGALPKKINTLITSSEYHPYLTDKQLKEVLFNTLNESSTLIPNTSPSDPVAEESMRLTCLLSTFEGFQKSERLLAYSEYPPKFEKEFTFDVKGVEEFGIIILATSTVTPSVELTYIDETSHQVPYQVEKQRTIRQTKKVPFWDVIFSK
jgi:hypothetical protein